MRRKLSVKRVDLSIADTMITTETIKLITRRQPRIVLWRR